MQTRLFTPDLENGVNNEKRKIKADTAREEVKGKPYRCLGLNIG